MRRVRHSTAGFTLIELLIALAVLILIAALVLPSLGSVSDSTKFRSACDQLSSAVSVCRAEARRTGKAVAVGVRKVEDGRQALVSVGVEAESAERGSSGGPRGNVLMYMPSGFSVGTAEVPAENAEATEKVMDNAVASTTLPVDGEASGSAETPTRNLIIFWAGGGATVQAPIVVRGPGGRQAGAKVNSWTGALSIQPEAEDAAAEPGKTGMDDIGDSGP